MINAEDFENTIKSAIFDGIKDKMRSQYNNPFDGILKSAIQDNHKEIYDLLNESIMSCMKDDEFREDVRSATRAALAKILVRRFGGELEKQVNNLKSDPATRARITLAIEEIIANSKS